MTNNVGFLTNAPTSNHSIPNEDKRQSRNTRTVSRIGPTRSIHAVIGFSKRKQGAAPGDADQRSSTR
ncbi:hypothetical protein N7535_007501 [Penicillium sp. DV-2018c]|nr:hypothetical protein N7461_003526 [Penicillium sp. DV-2018c]KAJ5565863.1 hypothetical protein N7535_007501 [Penicillium sp. DV-2018c]